MLGGEDTAVAVANDDRIGESFVGQIFRYQSIVFNAFGDSLIGAADAFAAVKSAHRVVAAAVEGELFIAQGGDMRREKARGADVKIHLVTVAIHRRAFARPVRRIIGAVKRVRWGFDSDKFGAH